MVTWATWLMLAKAWVGNFAYIFLIPKYEQCSSSDLSSEAIGGNVGEIFKLSQFAGRESLTDNSHVFFLKRALIAVRNSVWVEQGPTLMPQPLSWIWSSFSPPDLTITCMEVAPASRLGPGQRNATCHNDAIAQQSFCCNIALVQGGYLFSIISLMALAGLWITCKKEGIFNQRKWYFTYLLTSPAAILLTTASSSRWIRSGNGWEWEGPLQLLAILSGL